MEEFVLVDEERCKNFANKVVDKRMVFSAVFLHAVLTERDYMGFNAKVDCNDNERQVVLKLA